MDDKRGELVKLLLENSFRANLEEPFKLASGRTSEYYVDCKPTTLHPRGMRLVGEIVYEMITEANIEAVGGLTLGADPIACAVVSHAYTQGREMTAFVVRKESKKHGLQRWIEGGVGEGAKVLIVDDVVTTGESTAQAIECARESNLDVREVIVLVDRREGGAEMIQKRYGLRFQSVLTLRDLIDAQENSSKQSKVISEENVA